VLRQLTININSFEVEIPQEKSKSERLIASVSENDGFLTSKLSKQEYKISLLMFGWDEDITLQ
jgi:hypothetical protein